MSSRFQFSHIAGYLFKYNSLPPREDEDEGRERIPHTWVSSHENYLESIVGSVSYCVVILRKTPHWSVRMTSCNFRSLTWEQQIKITFAARVRTNNKFQIIIMGHGDSLSSFTLSCYHWTRHNLYACILQP